jgi:hypothetical protein
MRESVRSSGGSAGAPKSAAAAHGLGFRQGAHATLTQMRNERHKNASGRRSIAKRRMALLDFETEPGGQMFDGETWQIGPREFSEAPHVDGTWAAKAEPGALRLGGERRHVEIDGVADQRQITEKSREFRPRGREIRRTGHARSIDAMNFCRCGGDRFARIDQRVENVVCLDPPRRETHRAMFDHPCACGVETGGFRVESDRIESKQRGCTRAVGHGGLRFRRRSCPPGDLARQRPYRGRRISENRGAC